LSYDAEIVDSDEQFEYYFFALICVEYSVELLDGYVSVVMNEFQYVFELLHLSHVIYIKGG